MAGSRILVLCPYALCALATPHGGRTRRLMQHALYHQAQIDYIRAMGEEGWGEGRTHWEEGTDAVAACP